MVLDGADKEGENYSRMAVSGNSSHRLDDHVRPPVLREVACRAIVEQYLAGTIRYCTFLLSLKLFDPSKVRNPARGTRPG